MIKLLINLNIQIKIMVLLKNEVNKINEKKIKWMNNYIILSLYE